MVDTAPDPACEQTLRRRLGIPPDAARVLVIAESSHWDPNWLYTSEEYFTRWVSHNLDQALAALLQDPRRIYSIECMFFLRLYWERRPHQQEKIRALINEGRLRLTSSGVTTADTLLPSTEAILRDLLVGQEWLRAQGMVQEPHLAYFTDSFGSSPALPALLQAAGFDQAAITRIDGMYFAGSDYELPGRFPRPGSSAAQLLQVERSLDFVWRTAGGAEVLCHWNAFTYGQGDMLGYWGPGRTYLFPLSIPDRSGRSVARRIERLAAQLAPLSRTPYLFCPIGMDFVAPTPDLVGLLDGYNRLHYPQSGLWAVNAGLDDYLSLVACHRSRLPVLALDPNPYWTGFYTARPTLKGQCHELVDLLLQAERLALHPANQLAAPTISHGLQELWWLAASANHHDFITGTAPDRVAEGEQRIWLERGISAARKTITQLAPQAALTPGDEPARQRPDDRPQWRVASGRVEVQTPFLTLELAEEAGGGIVSARRPGAEAPLLAAVSGDLVGYRDTGGLWRMGHEYRGGALREVARASGRPARIEVRPTEGGLEIASTIELAGQTLRRLFWLANDTPLIWVRVQGRAAPGHAVMLRFAAGIAAGQLVMDAPGGVVARPWRKGYDPTFWPVQRFWHAQDSARGHGLALFLAQPGAIARRSDGRCEVIAVRNATRERAWGLLPIPALPATGHERREHTFECALLFTGAGDWQANALPQWAERTAASPWDTAETRALRELAASVAVTGTPRVAVRAVKPASRGQGIIIRLEAASAAPEPAVVALPGRTIRQAFLCDARERDIQPLTVLPDGIHLTLPGAIATIRALI